MMKPGLCPDLAWISVGGLIGAKAAELDRAMKDISVGKHYSDDLSWKRIAACFMRQCNFAHWSTSVASLTPERFIKLPVTCRHAICTVTIYAISFTSPVTSKGSLSGFMWSYRLVSSSLSNDKHIIRVIQFVYSHTSVCVKRRRSINKSLTQLLLLSHRCVNDHELSKLSQSLTAVDSFGRDIKYVGP